MPENGNIGFGAGCAEKRCEIAGKSPGCG